MGAQFQNVLFIFLLVAVFWFVAIRPQQQRTKQQRAMLAALEPGTEIVTIGGLYATVVEVGERVRVRVADGSELEVAKSAIAQALPAPATAADVKADDVKADEDDGETAPDA